MDEARGWPEQSRTGAQSPKFKGSQRFPVVSSAPQFMFLPQRYQRVAGASLPGEPDSSPHSPKLSPRFLNGERIGVISDNPRATCPSACLYRDFQLAPTLSVHVQEQMRLCAPANVARSPSFTPLKLFRPADRKLGNYPLHCTRPLLCVSRITLQLPPVASRVAHYLHTDPAHTPQTA